MQSKAISISIFSLYCLLFTDGVQNVTITFNGGTVPETLDAGDVLECSAIGRPEPNYDWTTNTSVSLANQTELTITHDMADQVVMITCTAYNYLKNVGRPTEATDGVTVYISIYIYICYYTVNIVYLK